MIHQVSYKHEADTRIAEADLLHVVKPARHWPLKAFSGRTECFNAPLLVDEIIESMDHDCEQKNQDAPDDLWYMAYGLDCPERDPIKRHRWIIERCKKDGRR